MPTAAEQALKQYFGYDSFREGQRPAVDALLSGRDVLCVMPTGAGKSLCYQVPALLMPGITVVVSPLISLMKDQVAALIRAGIPGAYLNSSLSPVQQEKALANMKAGKYKIVYAAPERLLLSGFLEACRTRGVSLVAVDEAHCVSQWGQDFRPDYLKIADFTDALTERPVIGAFTATATEEVARDIALRLRLKAPVRLKTGFDRPNLFYSVLQEEDRTEYLKRYIAAHPDRCGIVYCATRNTVEQVCEALRKAGIRAVRYHAGLTAEERVSSQEAFTRGDAPVIVATNAFGMGIDKPDVAFVIHYNMPKSMEAYYQEAGRAGRDGDPAECVLLYSAQDIQVNRRLIELPKNDALTPEEAKAVREAELERLRSMTGYAEETGCLRGYILRYFGEVPEKENCGNCSCCLGGLETVEVTEAGKQVLLCVLETGQRYGMSLIADVLKGSRSRRVLQLKLDASSFYGAFSGETLSGIRDLLSLLLRQECLSSTGGDYPVLRLGKKAERLLEGELRLTARRKEHDGKTRTVSGTSRKERLFDQGLFEALRRTRKALADAEGVPAFIIFSDATLKDMAMKKPRNATELLDVSGVGLAKQRKYGALFLQTLRDEADGRG